MLTPKTPNPRVGWGLTLVLIFWIVQDISRICECVTPKTPGTPLGLPKGPPGVGWVNCLGSNDSRINTHMLAKFGRGLTVVS